MSSRKPTGLVTGERFTGTMTRLSNSTSISWDVLQYGVPPVTNSPNATFTITRLSNVGATDQSPAEDIIAPFGTFFRAENLSGFNVSEPVAPLTGTGSNVYDPTQHKITYIWDFGDPGYTPVLTPNIPTAWRNTNIAYGRQVAHTFNAAGTYTVTCFAFDEAGNWGTATFSITVQNPDTFYADADTFWVSNTSNFTGAGTKQYTSLAAARTAISSYMTGGNKSVRLRIRAGEAYNEPGCLDFGGGSYRDNLKNLQVDIWGGSTRPTLQEPSIYAPANRYVRRFAFVNLDCQGDWDASKETGRGLGGCDFITSRAPMLIHRSKFSGLNSAFIGQHNEDAGTRFIFSDTEVTNWANYGIAFVPPSVALIGCDLHQHPDALNGIAQGTSDQRDWEFGNRHGPFRGGGTEMFVSCCSFFSRNAWSNSSGGTSYVSRPPTSPQSAMRFNGSGAISGTERRCWHVMDRCTFEGGNPSANLTAPLGTTAVNGSKNLVVDKAIIVRAQESHSSQKLGLHGTTFRNVIIFTPSASVAPITVSSEIFCFPETGTVVAANGPIEVYNVTAINNMAAGSLAASPVFLNNAGGYTVNQGNNIFRCAARSIGASFEPLNTATVAGFACRYKGNRWNFPPVVGPNPTSVDVVANTFTPMNRREQPGSPGVLQAGDVANLEWVNIPYPDWSGVCGSAGAALGVLNATKITANSTQKHQVSITRGSSGGTFQNMSDSTIWTKGDGRVAFNFHSSGIRIQNRTGTTWNSTNCGTIAVLLDMSDSLMSFVAGTSIEGVTVPIATPLAGSSALSTASGQVAQYDAFGATRNGKRLSTGEFKTGLPSQGWVEPA